MRGLLPSLVFLASTAAALGTSSIARADGPVKFGVGLAGGFGGNFLDKPSDKSFSLNGKATQDDPTSYPGFGGTNSAFGLALDVRVLGMVGLEIDVFKQNDRGHADWDFSVNGVKRSYVQEIGQPAWHIPVLLKGVLPSPLFSPMIFAGVDFVRPGTAEASITPAPTPFQITARADNYTMLMGGLGFEVALPVPGIDLRIPFQLRAALNNNVSDKLTDRQTITATGNNVITSVEYDSAWKWQAMATLGVQAYF